MMILLTMIHVIVCLILIFVILVQGGRGQGLTGPSFASGNVQSLFGTRAADFITKATSISAICFLLTCIGLDILEAERSRSLFEGPKQTAPIDIDAVKKALEKVKEEEAGKSSKPDTGASEAASPQATASAPAALPANETASQTAPAPQEKEGGSPQPAVS